LRASARGLDGGFYPPGVSLSRRFNLMRISGLIGCPFSRPVGLAHSPARPIHLQPMQPCSVPPVNTKAGPTNAPSSAAPIAQEQRIMSVVKVVELLAESDKSWEEAANQAVAKASKTLRGINSIYIKNMEAKVENNRITQYRINAKVSFTID
jgi:flavin-binding protein dodecin